MKPVNHAETRLLSAANTIPVVFIMGTTATGKTDAAAYLSQYLPVEIVSVDSSLVYRGMDIGTAKPDTDFLKKYPHHLVDIRNPDETYSAADFVSDATELVNDITQRGKIPLLVGGTSFYFSALELGLPELPPANPSIRDIIQAEADRDGWAVLHQKLSALDPKSGQRIDVNDPQRIQRALEIIELTGKPVADASVRQAPLTNPIIKIALSFSDRSTLHQRIQQRFINMVDAGLIEEVSQLIAQHDQNSPAFKMIGYRQVIEFLEQKTDFDKMINAGTISTRQLAKRQLTWLRNQQNVVWFVNDKNLIDKNFAVLLGYLNALVDFTAISRLS